MDILTALENVDWKDILKRALWTFLQAFIATVVVAGESIIDLLFLGDWDGLYALGIATSLAGIAAGLSAVKSIALEVVGQLKEAKKWNS